MPDYRKSAKERLIDSINAANPEALEKVSLVNCIFTSIASIINPRANTKVNITLANEDGRAGRVGSRSILYNRLDLTTFFGLVAEAPLVVDTADTTHELLPLIYEQYNVRLLPEDIINEPIVTGIYRIRATATSLGWLGSVDLATDVSTVYNVLTTDSGAAITLDSGAILLNA